MAPRAIEANANRKRSGIALLTFLAIPLVAPLFISLVLSGKGYPLRYTVFFAPYFVLVFFHSLEKIFERWQPAAAALIIALNAAAWLLFVSGPAYARQNWRGASDFLWGHLKPGEVVAVEQPFGIFPLWYYSGERMNIAGSNAGMIVGRNDEHRLLWLGVSKPGPALNDSARSAGRVWLVLCEEKYIDPDEWVLKNFETAMNGGLAVVFPSFAHGDEVRVLEFIPRPKLNSGKDSRAARAVASERG